MVCPVEIQINLKLLQWCEVILHINILVLFTYNFEIAAPNRHSANLTGITICTKNLRQYVKQTYRMKNITPRIYITSHHPENICFLHKSHWKRNWEICKMWQYMLPEQAQLEQNSRDLNVLKNILYIYIYWMLFKTFEYINPKLYITIASKPKLY